MPNVTDPHDTDGRLIAASQVNGTNVYDARGERLGSVHDVMLEKGSGIARYAIMSFGGFLGIGDRYHPLPWDQLRYDPGLGGFVVNLDRDRLEGAPVYEAEDIDALDERRFREINTYYGTHGWGAAGMGAGAVR